MAQNVKKTELKKGSYKWACSCGELFEGSLAGSMALARHTGNKDNKAANCSWVGLIDVVTKEVVATNSKAAVAQGYIPGSTKTKAKVQGKFQEGTPLRGKMKFETVEIPIALWILFQLACVRFPEEYGDDASAFIRWLTECVFGFYEEHALELGFDKLLRVTKNELNQEEDVYDGY